MEIRQLQYFVEVCKTGSFAMAAANCFITAQGISLSIKALENEFGTQLLVRTNKGVVPTDSGIVLLSEAKKILERVHACEEYFRKTVNDGSTIRLMVSLGVTSNFAAIPISQFLQNNPEIKIQLEEGSLSDCEKAVEGGKADLSLCTGDVNNSNVSDTVIHTEKGVLVVNVNHELASRDAVSIEDIKGCPLALIRSTTSTLMLLELCKRLDIQPNIQIYVNEPIIATTLVSTNMFCTVLPLSFAKSAELPNVRLIPFSEESMDWNIHLLKQKNGMLSPNAKSLEKQFLEHSKNLNNKGDNEKQNVN